MVDIRDFVLPHAALGGGADSAPPPLPDFLDSSKTAVDIDAKLSVPYSASIWRLLQKNQENPSRNFGENGVLVTSCSSILGQRAADV